MFDLVKRARRASVLLACAASTIGVSATMLPRAAIAQAVATISGSVVDSETGLGLAAASVLVLSTGVRNTTDASGTFTFGGIAPGSFRLRVERTGYQTADSSDIVVHAGDTVQVTLAIQRAPSGASTLRTIGTTTATSAQSLQKASTFYRTLSPESLIESGTYRFGDALRTLPGINNSIAGDTAALGDDLQLQIRGLGPIETTSTLDGHPIGVGAPGGFNYQLSPVFGLRNIQVTYGSAGTELTGVNAIGGVIDSQTIEPTTDRRVELTQGYGTFSRALTALQTTGTFDKLGYAFSYGVGGVDGPIKDSSFYQSGAAYDPSATDPAVRDLAIYKDDSTAITRSGLAKLRYSFSPQTRVTITSVNSSYWEDKTGNGDGDYLTPTVATAFGQQLLAGKAASDPCPAGQFTATNPNGVPWGTGPSGAPDGGSPCQTPQSYAHFASGWQGAGPAWQSFNFNDQALHFESDGARQNLRFDAYTNRYFNTGDRTFQLPFNSVPGDNGSWTNRNVSTTGAQISDNFVGRNNEFAVGYQYDNYAYDLQRDAKLTGSPIVHENGPFVREAYHPQGSPLAAYASAYFKHSTTTDTSYVDPRASLVFTAPRGRDVVRLAAGATTAQPTANLLDVGFTPSKLTTAGGGGGITCGGLNSAGSAPSTLLRPERGVDEEFAYGHRFGGDSQVELQLYNLNVYDKIASTIVPLSTTGTGFLTASQLAAAEAAIASTCGATVDPLALLGVSGSVNVNQLRSRGFTIQGRQRISPATFFDYDYNVVSTAVVSAPASYLQQNLTVVPGAQLPRLPLDTLNFAADGLVTRGVDVRYTLHAIGDNNTKRVAGYNYSDLRVAGVVGPGTLAVTVNNLWNQNAFIQGYLYQGEPLALNQYATRASYAPYVGAAATELFGLPYRGFFVTYTLQSR